MVRIEMDVRVPQLATLRASGKWVLRHLRDHQVLYLRLVVLALILQWCNVIGQPNAWRMQHKSFGNSGYKIGLWMIEYESAGWMSPAWWTCWGAGVAAAVLSPVVVIWYTWATLSWMTIGVSAAGLGIAAFFSGGAALLPMLAAVAVCVNGAALMYCDLLPKFLRWWDDKTQEWKPNKHGKYYWPQAAAWSPQEKWRGLEIGSAIMFFMGVLIVFIFIFVLFRNNFSRKGKDRALGMALLVSPVLGFVGVTQYYYAARRMPPAGWIAGADGCFDWAFNVAIALSFFNFLPALLEVNYRWSFRLWELSDARPKASRQTRSKQVELV